VDAVVYTTLLTMIFFLILRIPGIWNEIGLEKTSHNTDLHRSAAALVLIGLLSLTVQSWEVQTHMFDGVNYADTWHSQLTIIG
jgi:hypothetical protein